nr:hypothetical protein [Tanacetum cinerariifolium]
MNNELPQTLPSFDPTCYPDKENSVPCVSTPNIVDESFNFFNPPPQPSIYSCEFYGSNAQYGHYCTPQVSFINPEPGYSQDFNFPQNIHDFQQQYLCCDQCGGPHETFQYEVIKFSVEDLVPIPSEFEGIPDTMCDVHLVNNPTPLEAKDHFEIVTKSNDDISSSDDDSLYNENIEYVEALPHDSELVSLECPLSDMSDLTHEEFTDELTHIISPPEYDRFYFWNLLDPGELISILNFGIRKNLSTTSVNLPVEDDHSPLLAYVVWIFLAYLMYPVIPPYLHPFWNEDTIFDPGITINRVYSFKPSLSHRCGAFKKFNTHRSHLNEWPMIINGKNTPILDVLLFHFYPPPLINSSMGGIGSS